ncbi:MAG: enzyme of heme biosynthesis [Alistipes sp.]|nr:enzyme of heme biosynthesis [Alistipes sp.]MBQ3247810.1 enzyme of heme biosynthesis [Alistipes sp.]
MKSIKVLLSAAFAVVSMTAVAQDFSDPQYANWGETPDERRENIVNSQFLKESIDNQQYDLASGYFKTLVAKCPTASQNIYVNGIKLYQKRIAKSKTLAEKKANVDSLMWAYDLRNQYFGSHAKYGSAYILERKARELLTYNQSDRAGIRKVFTEAIEAAVAKNGVAGSELVAIYFKNLCDDYVNEEVEADLILAEYERLSPMFTDATEEDKKNKEQFETAFGLSGAANCDNLERLFSKKLSENPDDVAVLSQAVALMSRANCESDFFFQTTEKFYQVQPSAETALFLAQAFQNKKEFDKAKLYLHEAIKVEENPAEKVKLYVRIAVVELAAQNFVESAAAAKEAIAIEPENGYAYFILAQTYALGNNGCSGLAKDATFWAAYDMMSKAVSLLDEQPDVKADAQKFMATYRNFFPTAEECFFNELKEGSAYTVGCGTARGEKTIVRFRPQ